MTDGQTEESNFIGGCPTNVERPIVVSKSFLLVNNISLVTKILKKIRPLCIFWLQVIIYKRNFDENRLIYFLIKEEKFSSWNIKKILREGIFWNIKKSYKKSFFFFFFFFFSILGLESFILQNIRIFFHLEARKFHFLKCMKFCWGGFYWPR